MAVKNRPVSKKQADQLANELADKTYGKAAGSNNESSSRTSFVLPLSMQQELEDLAIYNKRNGKDLKSVSAIVRKAIADFLKKQSNKKS